MDYVEQLVARGVSVYGGGQGDVTSSRLPDAVDRHRIFAQKPGDPPSGSYAMAEFPLNTKDLHPAWTIHRMIYCNSERRKYQCVVVVYIGTE
jgi:hypothetical protein